MAVSDFSPAFVTTQEAIRMVTNAWPGTRLGSFIGHGGFSDVWSLTTDSQVVKVTSVKTVSLMLGGISQWENAKHYLLLEAQLTRRFGNGQHRNLIRCFDVVYLNEQFRPTTEPECAYVLLRLEKLEPVSPANVRSQQDIVALLRDIGTGLDVLHNQKIIHRDCTVSNIFWSSRLSCFVLGDLGVARSARGSANSNTHLCQRSDIHPFEVKTPSSRHPLRPCTDLFILGASVLKYARRNGIALDQNLTALLNQMKQHSMDKRVQTSQELLRRLPKQSPAQKPIFSNLLSDFWSDRKPSPAVRRPERELVSQGTDTVLSSHDLNRFRPLLLKGNYQEVIRELTPQSSQPAASAVVALAHALAGSPKPVLATQRDRLLTQAQSSAAACLMAAVLSLALEPNGSAQTVRLFQSACDRSTGALKALAQYYWGRCLLYGHGTDKNQRAAQNLLRQAADAGCKTAELVPMVFDGRITPDQFRATRRKEMIQALTAQ